ncbi:MAG: hypothetical protein AB1641_22050 [Thermodesulfobacteriota bacterium]
MKIAIITSFSYFNPGYSLTGIVLDQAHMLAAHGHEVVILCQEQADLRGYDAPYLIRPILPFTHLVDYQSRRDLSTEHEIVALRTANVLADALRDFDCAFTHDLIFTGWNLPYAEGIRHLSKGPKVPRFAGFHWIHSIPNGRRDWWDIRAYGPNHKLVYPNRTDAMHVAAQFRGTPDDVTVIPHIKDPRSWMDFSDDTRRFIEAYPAVLRADIVQVLPAAQDRLEAKRVREVIKIFGVFKILENLSVCLVVANQWATQTTYKRSLDRYRLLAAINGLEPGVDFIFTSDFEPPRFEAGIPKRMIRELFSLANLFIFPTDHESFGLVVPEAALAGCFLVLNGSLAQQKEISGGFAQYHDFGAWNSPSRINSPLPLGEGQGDPARCGTSPRREPLGRTTLPLGEGQGEGLARTILDRLRANEAIMTRTHARQTYNWDSIYENHYAPILTCHCESRPGVTKQSRVPRD